MSSAASAAVVGDIPGVRVRRLGPMDVPVIAPLFDAYRAFYGVAADPGAQRFLSDRIANGESVVFGAAPAEAPSPDLIGFALIYPSYSSLTLRRVAILNDLYVAPAWRRSGVARSLIAAAVQHVTAGGAAYIELATQHANEPAQRLYRSLGFVPDTEFARLTLVLNGESSNGRS